VFGCVSSPGSPEAFVEGFLTCPSDRITGSTVPFAACRGRAPQAGRPPWRAASACRGRGVAGTGGSHRWGRRAVALGRARPAARRCTARSLLGGRRWGTAHW